MWYAVYIEATGELKSSGSSLSPVLPNGMASKSWTDRPAPGLAWNPATLEWDTPFAPAPRPISIQEFWLRFTEAERTTIRGLNSNKVKDWIELIKLDPQIDPQGALAQSGLNAMVTAGILTQARADEIGAV